MLKHAEARRLLDLGFKLCALHPMSKRPVGNFNFSRDRSVYCDGN